MSSTDRTKMHDARHTVWLTWFLLIGELTGGIVSHAQPVTEPQVIERILRQRATIRAAGQVVDRAGEPIPDVRLGVTLHWYDPATLETRSRTTVRHLTDGRFNLHQDGISAMALVAEKEGFLGASWHVRYLDLVVARQNDLTRRVAEGTLDPEDLRAHRTRYYTDLSGGDTNLVLVLDRLDGTPARRPDRFPILMVTTNRPEAVGTLFSNRPPDEPRHDLHLTWRKPSMVGESGGDVLELRTTPGGGIRRMPPEVQFKNLVRAPKDGYSPSISLPIPRRHQSVRIVLRTREGYHAKIDGAVSRRPKGDSLLFEVLDAAIQDDGSRILYREGDIHVGLDTSEQSSPR